MGLSWKIEVSPTSARTVSYDGKHDKPAAPAHDRGHGRAQARPAFTKKPPPSLRTVCRVSEAPARGCGRGRCPPFPAASINIGYSEEELAENMKIILRGVVGEQRMLCDVRFYINAGKESASR